MLQKLRAMTCIGTMRTHVAGLTDDELMCIAENAEAQLKSMQRFVDVLEAELVYRMRTPLPKLEVVS